MLKSLFGIISNFFCIFITHKGFTILHTPINNPINKSISKKPINKIWISMYMYKYLYKYIIIFIMNYYYYEMIVGTKGILQYKF